MTEDLLSIGEVSQRTGLQPSALRYYETAGLIRPRARIGGRRHYEPNVVRRLAAVGLLQEVGFTIAEIKAFFSSRNRRDRWRIVARAKLAEIDEHLAKVQKAKDLLSAALECGCDTFDECALVGSRPARHRRTLHQVTLGGGPR